MATEILMPSLAAGMEEATLMRWLKHEGDAVAKGDVLAEIETDKAIMEMESEVDGKLGQILVPASPEAVQVGTLIAVVLDEEESSAVLDTYQTAQTVAPQPDSVDFPASPTPAPSPVPDQASVQRSASLSQTSHAQSSNSAERVFASPLARRLANQAGITLNSLTGSGPRGRIVRLDVERALQQPPAATATVEITSPDAAIPPQGGTDASVERIPNSGMRKTIARRLCESKQTVPHFYLTVDCRVDELLELRSKLNANGSRAKPAYKLSVNDFIVFAAARALRRVPEVNASWTEAEVIRYLDVDISVAVATESGLITPVVREVDRKGLAEITTEVRSLADRARAGKLAPSEYQGGGFTISNLGMYGIREFSAIINPPQSAILAVGAVEKRPVVVGDQLAVGSMMTLTLSADHRVVDGSVGARFLSELKDLLEEPLNLLV
ncbi:MAG: pyruvate dehydrogenase complex dihydrolipoamide acetyltransferase [Halomonas sp.]|nr:pyruvate dehydrogenase complex dihydrolipoamide acetyltransferase [Halomonas sp.]MCC5901887.1 pyruvate dehydrogenase complex dihydrolipoamide acetyltransferase [Halomonas sp.]